jgi:hypothetical protein
MSASEKWYRSAFYLDQWAQCAVFYRSDTTVRGHHVLVARDLK